MYLYRYKTLNFKIVISLLVLSFLFGVSSRAQQDEFGWRISAGYGYTNYYGDLSNYPITWKNAGNIFKLFHLNTSNISVSNLNNSMLNSYSFSIERKWTKTIGIIVQYSHNIIYGNDRTDLNGNLNPSNLNFSRALNFKSNLNDVSLGFVFRADNDHILRGTSFLAPYLTLTAGYTFFNTKADLYDASGNHYNYLTDGTISGGITPDGVYETSLQPLMTEYKKYESKTLNAGLGLGIRFRITSRFGIHAESVLHHTFTDYLDDVSGNYPTVYQSANQEYASNPTGIVRTTRGSSDAKDIFVYNSISLRFSFGAAKKTLYHVPVFNPNSYLRPLEEPATKTIRDTVTLGPDTIQDASKQPEKESLVINAASDAEKKEHITSKEGKDYEIRILKKDSTNSKTNITVDNGRIIEISIENSDIIIKGYRKGNELISTQYDDSIKFRMPVIRKVTENNIVKDSTERAIIEEPLNKQNILENQLVEKLIEINWKNEIFQTKMDSLNKVNEDQRELFMQRILAMETKVSGQSETTILQPEKEKLQREQLEQESKLLSVQEKIEPDSNNMLDLGASYKEDTASYEKQKEDLDQKIDTITKENQIQQADIGRLSRQIETQNKSFNEKLVQMQQQQRNSQIEVDQKTLDYLESLRRIQEVNTMRITQPEMDSLLKQEFRKLSLQIQKYENERLITTIPEISDTIKKTENIHLKDSIMRLQSELKEIKDRPVEVMNKIIEQPVETIKVVKTIDIESIPVIEVFFELGSAEVRDSEETKIRQIAQLLSNYPESKVILTGMADAIGNSDRNLELSLQRAEYVKELLVKIYAIDLNRIRVDSIGSTMSEGESAFDRKVNMRLVSSF